MCELEKVIALELIKGYRAMAADVRCITNRHCGEIRSRVLVTGIDDLVQGIMYYWSHPIPQVNHCNNNMTIWVQTCDVVIELCVLDLNQSFQLQRWLLYPSQ